MRTISKLAISLLLSACTTGVWAKDIVHDAEYYILESQNGERWAAEDVELDQKLAALKEKYGQPPNIVYILWDDQQVGAVGNAMIQKNLGYTTPNINKMAAEGINFTRMYSEPACTPTRAAFLTGRLPVRNGMAVVGMPIGGQNGVEGPQGGCWGRGSGLQNVSYRT